MNEVQFQKMYNTAIKKVAVGFYILDCCGSRLGYDADMIHTNKEQLCDILSEGIHVPSLTIFSDACFMYCNIPSDYIVQLRHSGLLEELVDNMQAILRNAENLKLGYKTLDN